MKTVFFLRSGKHTTRANIRKARLSMVAAYRGAKNDLPRKVDEPMARAVEGMTEERFCDWTGCATWRKIGA